MPIVKLRFLALTIEIFRVIVTAVRRGGLMLLLVVVLEALLQMARLKPVPMPGPYAPTSLLLDCGDVLVEWMTMLVIVRASLGGRIGLDLLRPDRPALMLLGLQAALMVVMNLRAALPDPHNLALKMLIGTATMVALICWSRATLLLQVAWALGRGEVTLTEAWNGLKGNFFRILVFCGVWMLLGAVILAAVTYGIYGTVVPPRPTADPTVWVVLVGMFSVLFGVLPVAIYRQLVDGPARPDGLPASPAVAA